VSEQNVLDLRGSDVLRTPDDRVVGAPADKQVTVLIQVTVIPGVEEAAVVDRAPQARVLGGYLTAAHEDPACLPGAEDLAARAADFKVDPGSGLPTEDKRARTAGSGDSSAARWSSGPSSVTVELVSVSPYALTKSTPAHSRSARSISAAGIGAPP
jgi:hypothetical protein